MSKNFYITTPIYYVNDRPHIGSAYTTLVCDVVARFKRAEGYKVLFLTGTDEHGQKIEKAAEAKNIPTQKFSDGVADKFRELTKKMNFSNDDFIRTTEERHKEGAKAFWKILDEKGYIYKGEYSGWYAIKDEAFYSEDELVDGKAPTGAEVQWLAEESYFFKLSTMGEKLLDFYDKNPNFIYPKSRMNEVRKFVEQGLEDLSISRTSFDWGIPVPGDEKHVMYVWLDALTNYINALGYPNINGELYKDFWPADIHMVGKDITRFHAIYWPAFLLAAGIKLPKQIVSHGWWLAEGEKMSKSLGNVIDPIKLIEDYGLDETRYYLMKEISFGQDGTFSQNTLRTRINGELANKIGNLIQRTMSMVHKNCGEAVPNISDLDELYKRDLLEYTQQVFTKVKSRFDKHEYDKALNEIILLAEKGNEYVNDAAPWDLKKTDEKEMQKVLYELCEVIRYIAILLSPFLPEAANNILELLGIDSREISFKLLSKNYAVKPGQKIVKPGIIFRKID
ncbi:MAG: methionine--tRNA ligase [Rickettsiales bacterium]